MSTLLAAGSILIPTAAAAASGEVRAPAALMGVGFLLAVFGHLAKSRWLIATGLILIAVAAILLQFTFRNESHGPPPLPGGAGGSG